MYKLYKIVFLKAGNVPAFFMSLTGESTFLFYVLLYCKGFNRQRSHSTLGYLSPAEFEGINKINLVA